MNSIFKWERRDYKQKKETYTAHLLLAILLFLFALAYSADKFGLTNVARAEGVKPQQIHSMEGACKFAKEYPNKIVNVKELLAECNK